MVLPSGPIVWIGVSLGSIRLHAKHDGDFRPGPRPKGGRNKRADKKRDDIRIGPRIFCVVEQGTGDQKIPGQEGCSPDKPEKLGTHLAATLPLAVSAP